MIDQMVRLVILLLLAPAMWVFVEQAWPFLAANLPLALTNWGFYGLAVYLLFYPFFLGNVMTFAETLVHELIHSVTLWWLLPWQSS